MLLDALEFTRRFLLHVLPKGFVRIRYYGFRANAQRNKKLARIRELLGQNQNPQLVTFPPQPLNLPLVAPRMMLRAVPGVERGR
jgi:hypothetical protein